MTAAERFVFGKITRSALETRKSRPPASTIVASDAAMAREISQLLTRLLGHHFWARRSISSGGTSSTWVATLQVVSERVLELAAAVPIELVLDGSQLGGAGRQGRLETASTSSTYTLIVTGVPPTLFGLRAPMSGFSSASMTRPSPISSSAWPTFPSGPSMRIRSFAPKASA